MQNGVHKMLDVEKILRNKNHGTAVADSVFSAAYSRNCVNITTSSAIVPRDPISQGRLVTT
jgi:hypothetical protein